MKRIRPGISAPALDHISDETQRSESVVVGKLDVLIVERKTPGQPGAAAQALKAPLTAHELHLDRADR